VLLPEDFEVKVLVLPEGADPDEFVRAHGADEYNRLRGEAAPHMQFILDQAMHGRNLLNPPEKSEAVAEVLPFVRAVRNTIQKREYFDIMMDSLRIEDLSLRQELWKTVSARDSLAANAEEIRKKVVRASVGAPTVAEKRLLELLLHDADLRGYILPQVHESDYEGLATAAIFEALRHADAEGVEVGFDSLNELLGGDPAQAFLPELWMHEPERAEGEAVDVFLSEAEGCLTTLRLMSYERRIKELAAEIAAAGRAGDEARHGTLLMKKFELEKQLYVLRPRAGSPASPSTT
jgi:DNA primase